jgi:gluconolactonase
VDSLTEVGRARVFYDGSISEPRLDHPEGVAVHRDGSVWCGGERGQIYRLTPDGSHLDEICSTGGFCLGLAFDPDDDLYVCDLKHAAVFHVETRTGRVRQFADRVPGHRMRVPNYPVVDAKGRIYVSDSHGAKDPGPGVLRFEPDGLGTLWFGEPVNFANGLAIAPDGRHLYVAETFAHGVFRIPIGEDGSAGRREPVATLPGVLPDGLTFGPDGRLYIGCYEPSQILRLDRDGAVSCLLADPEAHLLCHPTNLAFRGSTLFAANLGRWHLTVMELPRETLNPEVVT